MVMYDGIQAYGGIKGLGAVALIYFLFLFIAGNFILLNVFLAIAVDNLSVGDEEEEGGEEEEAPALPPGEEDMIIGPDGTLIPAILPKDEMKIEMEGYYPGQYDEFGEEYIPYQEQEDDEGNFEEPTRKERVIEDPSPVNKVEPIPAGASFFIFSQDNSLRIFCHWLQGHPIMGNFILVCIIVSSALLACEDPLRSKSPINNVSIKIYNNIIHDFKFIKSWFTLYLVMIFTFFIIFCFRLYNILTTCSQPSSPWNAVSSSLHTDSCSTKEPFVDHLSISLISWSSLCLLSPYLEEVVSVSSKFFVCSVC